MHWLSAGAPSSPPAAKDTSSHTEDLSSLTVISCSKNCVWEHAVYLRTVTVVSMALLRWLLSLRGNRLTTAGCEGPPHFPRCPAGTGHSPPSPSPPARSPHHTPPYLNPSSCQQGTCREEHEAGQRVTVLQFASTFVGILRGATLAPQGRGTPQLRVPQGLWRCTVLQQHSPGHS